MSLLGAAETGLPSLEWSFLHEVIFKGTIVHYVRVIQNSCIYVIRSDSFLSVQLAKRCTSVMYHILMAHCPIICVVHTTHSPLQFLFQHAGRIAVGCCFICGLFAVTFLFFGIRVVIVYDASIRLLCTLIVNLSKFSICVFLLLITGIYNIAAPQLLVETLVLIFEKREFIKYKNKSASNQDGK